MARSISTPPRRRTPAVAPWRHSYRDTECSRPSPDPRGIPSSVWDRKYRGTCVHDPRQWRSWARHRYPVRCRPWPGSGRSPAAENSAVSLQKKKRGRKREFKLSTVVSCVPIPSFLTLLHFVDWTIRNCWNRRLCPGIFIPKRTHPQLALGWVLINCSTRKSTLCKLLESRLFLVMPQNGKVTCAIEGERGEAESRAETSQS